jgi:hypothetical protein
VSPIVRSNTDMRCWVFGNKAKGRKLTPSVRLNAHADQLQHQPQLILAASAMTAPLPARVIFRLRM